MTLTQIDSTTLKLKSGEEVEIPLCECGKNRCRFTYYRDIDEIIWRDCLECAQGSIKISQAITNRKRLQVLPALLKEMGVCKLHMKANIDDLDKPEEWEKDLYKSLYIYGESGNGKTYAAVALLRELLLDGAKAEITTMTDLLYRIRRSYNKTSEETEDFIINHYIAIPHLFIDDVGTEKITEWAAATIYQIFDKRYREQMHTVFTSNLSLKDLPNHLDPRLASRIAEWCKVIHMKGKDRRIGRFI